MTSSKRNSIKIIAFILSTLCLLGLIGFVLLYFLFLQPFKLSNNTLLYIDRDDNIDSVYCKLQRELNLNQTPMGFSILANYKTYSDNIKTGKYTIEPTDNNYTLFIKLSRGHQTPTKLTLNNIRTLDQLTQVVSKQLMLEDVELQRIFENPKTLEEWNYTYETLPALFIPNTYEVYWNISAEDFINRMIKEHQRFWTESRRAKAKKIGLTPTEVATLASIVEEETNDTNEKPIVAGLYINRLQRGIPLQADPTIKFSLQNFELRRILEKDLAVESAYNTYLHAGLPPGPIRLATISGLESVLNYKKHNYIYMCAKEDFSGKHNFATNLRDHTNNARRYWNALNKRKIYK